MFWSPDGSAVYYSSGKSLWSVPVSGGAPELVLEDAGTAALHPDGHTLFFTRDGKIWVGSLGGREAPHPISWQPHDLPLSAGWRDLRGFGVSDGGAQLAVTAGSDLWIVPYPSGAARKVLAGGNWTIADWLPDNRRLLLKTSRDNTSTLEMLDSKDGSRRTIFTTPDIVFSASVSPDGKRIALSTGAVADFSRWSYRPKAIAAQALGIRVFEGRPHGLRHL